MKNKYSTKDLNLSSNERLQIEKSSIFQPRKYTKFFPKNLKIFTLNAGFKSRNDDLLIIIFDDIVNAASVFSKTSTPSAPIIWNKRYNKNRVKALIVNSGNANAHTGSKGIKIINDYVNFLSKKINCKKSEIHVSSTGVIGELFNPIKIINKIKTIDHSNNRNLLGAAKAIMTTDTYPKLYHKKIIVDKKLINFYGNSKRFRNDKP